MRKAKTLSCLPCSPSLAVALTGVLTGLLGGCGAASDLDPEAQPAHFALADEAKKATRAMSALLPYSGVGEAHLSGTVMARPYKYKVPKGYDPAVPTPLLVLLHGLTASGELQSLYLGLAPLSDSRKFLYVYPDGTQNPLGARFWNATDFCCNFFGSDVDDVAYLTAVIDDMASRFNVDSRRIFLVGHSNGGFMAHRMACDRSSRIAGIVSLAGAQWNDALRCNPTDKVAVLQVHGTLDALVAYNGGPLYPSAHETVAIWANRNRCLGRLTDGGTRLDLDGVLLGAETTVERYTGCAETGAVELWTIRGASHVPAFTSFWPGALYDFLMTHPKP